MTDKPAKSSSLIPYGLCAGLLFLLVLDKSGVNTSITSTAPAATAPPCVKQADSASSARLRNAYIGLMKNTVTGSLFDEMGACVMGSGGGCDKQQPYVHAKRLKGGDWPYVGHTMVGHMRIDNIRMALEDVINNNVPGDFLEMGVWRGGACAYARAVLNVYEQRDRSVHLFDAFESIAGYGGSSKFLANTEAQVKHNLDKYELSEGTYFHKGLFKDTVPSFAKAFTGQIAVLRIDGNYYDSYQDAMYYLYDKVPVGGYVIFDDIMSHSAVRRFWEDFKRDQGVPEDITPIDDHSAYFKKTKAIATDFKFFRAPQDANK